jgi:ubiquinone/menaquinone biosynthesis C-methylase UbiE
MRDTNFDPVARPYRWMEYATFGKALERARFFRLSQLKGVRRALILGGGDGRFTARLIAMNPTVEVDAVDSSAKMLRLLERRAGSISGGRGRVSLHHGDVRRWLPERKNYDLVVMNFLLDCLDEQSCAALAQRVGESCATGALVVVTEFAVVSGWMRIPSWAIVRGLYFGFQILAGLRATHIPDYAKALQDAGFNPIDCRSFRAGLLRSELWQKV